MADTDAIEHDLILHKAVFFVYLSVRQELLHNQIAGSNRAGSPEFIGFTLIGISHGLNGLTEIFGNGIGFVGNKVVQGFFDGVRHLGRELFAAEHDNDWDND